MQRDYRTIEVENLLGSSDAYRNIGASSRLNSSSIDLEEVEKITIFCSVVCTTTIPQTRPRVYMLGSDNNIDFDYGSINNAYETMEIDIASNATRQASSGLVNTQPLHHSKFQFSNPPGATVSIWLRVAKFYK